MNSLNRDGGKKKQEYRNKWIGVAKSFGYEKGGECLAFKTAWFCAVDMMFKELSKAVLSAKEEAKAEGYKKGYCDGKTFDEQEWKKLKKIAQTKV